MQWRVHSRNGDILANNLCHPNGKGEGGSAIYMATFSQPAHSQDSSAPHRLVAHLATRLNGGAWEVGGVSNMHIFPNLHLIDNSIVVHTQEVGPA